MKSKYFKFTNKFFENEKSGLLKHFPELNNIDVFEILDGTYISYDDDDDDVFGITKIKNTKTNEIFEISELKDLLSKENHSWWCFICTDFGYEYEEVENYGD